MTAAITQDFLSIDELIPERILIWMHRRRVTRTVLADALGVTTASLSRRMTGSTAWTVKDLLAAAQVLDLPLNALLPNDAVEMTKASRSRDREASAGIVAGTGFEPATSGLRVFRLFLARVYVLCVGRCCARAWQLSA